MTPHRQDLIEAVGHVQNMLECPIDIVTFCGWNGVTEAEIEKHLEYYVRRVQEEINAKIKGIRKPRAIRKLTKKAA